jgi:hypothetical protein
MRTHHHIRSLQVAIVVCALQLLASNARGEVWKSQELNCEITLPSGSDWSRVTPPAPILKVAMRNEAQGKTISLYVVDAPRDGQSLSSFLPGFKTAWFKEGVSTDRSEESLVIDGRSAHRLMDTIAIQGTVMRRVNTLVIDNGQVYQIAAMSRSGNPLDDPEIATTLKSFHFVSAVSALPVTSPRQDPADRLPQLIGSITFYVLVGIVAIFLVIKVSTRSKPKS